MRANPNDVLPLQSDTFVKPGSQVVVTVGRGTGFDGDRMLWAIEWTELQDTVRQALTDLLSPTSVFGPFTGEGEWGGKREECSVVIALSRYPASVKTIDNRLAQIARDYGQEAIAWTHGPAFLATP